MDFMSDQGSNIINYASCMEMLILKNAQNAIKSI